MQQRFLAGATLFAVFFVSFYFYLDDRRPHCGPQSDIKERDKEQKAALATAASMIAALKAKLAAVTADLAKRDEELKAALAKTSSESTTAAASMAPALNAIPLALSIPQQFYANWGAMENAQLNDYITLKVNKGCQAATCYPTRERLLDLFHHNVDPYVGLRVGDAKDFDSYVSFAQQHAHAMIPKVVKMLGGPPRFVIEVGSFIGSGIVHAWAPLAKLHPQGIVLSMDPWLGDVNMRVLGPFIQPMKFKHGIPQIALTFMRRMIHMNLSQHVIPLPLPSLVGARLLEVSRLTIDFIYVDSAHEHGETYVEAAVFLKLLRIGGLLCGDDYDVFPAVKADIDRFALDFNLQLIFISPGQWCVKKAKEY